MKGKKTKGKKAGKTAAKKGAAKKAGKNTGKKEKKGYADCAPKNCFWVCDGQILKNLKEMVTALDRMSKETFEHHVNAEKNDFAVWICDVIEDHKLSAKVSKLKKKSAIKKTVQAALR